MSETNFTILAYSDNSPGVLQRVTIVFTKRKLNIESLTVSETEIPGVSRFTIVARCTHEIAQKVASQVERIVEVRKVILCQDEEVCFRELSMFKIKACKAEGRKELEALLDKYRAEIVLENESGMIIENAGSEEETRELFAALQPYGLKEFVRSGRIALLKTDQAGEDKTIAHADTATEAESLTWL